MREKAHKRPEGRCAAQKRASTVKNGAQELDCGVVNVIDLEGRKLDALLPECVEADVHAGGDRI
eukprot:6181081-Pleurochrysis_carterae.AAC.1